MPLFPPFLLQLRCWRTCWFYLLFLPLCPINQASSSFLHNSRSLSPLPGSSLPPDIYSVLALLQVMGSALCPRSLRGALSLGRHWNSVMVAAELEHTRTNNQVTLLSALLEDSPFINTSTLASGLHSSGFHHPGHFTQPHRKPKSFPWTWRVSVTFGPTEYQLI